MAIVLLPKAVRRIHQHLDIAVSTRMQLRTQQVLFLLSAAL